MSEAAAVRRPAPARDLPPPVPFLPAARAAFDLSLEGMVWSRRTLAMAVLLALPVVFGVVYRLVLVYELPARIAAVDFYAFIVSVYYVRNVLPLTALFYATALIADEVEGRTITYLLTRPIRRTSLLAGKFAAYLGTTLALALPSLVLTFFLLTTARGFRGTGGAVPHLFRDMGVAALTLVAYGALFTLLGILLRRPVIPGLLFLFVWELVANLPGYLPRFTLTVWLRSLVGHHPPGEGLSGLFGQVLPVALSLQVLVLATAAFLALSGWIFSRREYVLEQ